MIPKNEYAAYFEHYIQLAAAKNRSIIENLQHSQQAFDSVLTKPTGRKTQFFLCRREVDPQRIDSAHY